MAIPAGRGFHLAEAALFSPRRSYLVPVSSMIKPEIQGRHRINTALWRSDPFDVLVGVKQGWVVAPVIFNLFLVAVTLASRDDFPPMPMFLLSTVWMVVCSTYAGSQRKPRSLMTGFLSFSMLMERKAKGQRLQSCHNESQRLFYNIHPHSINKGFHKAVLTNMIETRTNVVQLIPCRISQPKPARSCWRLTATTVIYA